jgi:hypothetical protein
MTFCRKFADIFTLKCTPTAPTLQGFAKGNGGVKNPWQRLHPERSHGVLCGAPYATLPHRSYHPVNVDHLSPAIIVALLMAGVEIRETVESKYRDDINDKSDKSLNSNT